jgi:hypothetical protein
MSAGKWKTYRLSDGEKNKDEETQWKSCVHTTETFMYFGTYFIMRWNNWILHEFRGTRYIWMICNEVNETIAAHLWRQTIFTNFYKYLYFYFIIPRLDVKVNQVMFICNSLFFPAWDEVYKSSWFAYESLRFITYTTKPRDHIAHVSLCDNVYLKGNEVFNRRYLQAPSFCHSTLPPLTKWC